MAQSNSSGGGGQGTSSAPGEIYLQGHAANIGVDVRDTSHPIGRQHEHPNQSQQRQSQHYTNYGKYYQSATYGDPRFSVDVIQNSQPHQAPSSQQDKTTFEQDLGAALGIGHPGVGLPNQQASFGQGQDDGHNIWAQFLESQQTSMLTWDPDSQLLQVSEQAQTSEKGLPTSITEQSSSGHDQYQYANDSGGSNIRYPQTTKTNLGTYGEQYGVPRAAHDQHAAPLSPQLQQHGQIQPNAQSQRYELISQSPSQLFPIYGNHQARNSSFDRQYAPVSPHQHPAQQQLPRNPTMQAQMHDSNSAGTNTIAALYATPATQQSPKRDAIPYDSHIFQMYGDVEPSTGVESGFYKSRSTSPRKQTQPPTLDKPVYPPPHITLPVKQAPYDQHTVLPKQRQQQIQASSKSSSQMEAIGQASQPSAPISHNKSIPPPTPTTNTVYPSITLEPPRKRVKRMSTNTASITAAPSLKDTAATPMKEAMNRRSGGASPTLTALKTPRLEDSDAKYTKVERKESRAIPLIKDGPLLSAQTGFQSPLSAHTTIAPVQSNAAMVQAPIPNSHLASQAALNAMSRQLDSADILQAMSRKTPAAAQSVGSSQTMQRVKAAVLPGDLPRVPQPQQPLQATNTIKLIPATAIVEAKKEGDIPKLPKLTDVDRDELLATMVAESDYVDPPMTRSEYIASLGEIPEVVTTVPYNRLEYFAKSSVPSDVSAEVYAREGIEAAIASRLPPFALHSLEYALLKNDINHLHVTTYLSIRNGILRLWRMNHHVSVTRVEAAGCARDPRFFGLAEAAFELLVRHGYINFGVVDIPRCRNNFPYVLPIPAVRRPRLQIVVIGAGMAGLGCARQLDGLFKQYDDFLSGYEATPEIVILEGRQRIGGRVYSAPLRKEGNQKSGSHKVDLGGQIITGFGNGNPLAVIVRKQLGIKCHELQDAGALYDEVEGGAVSASLDRRSEGLFNDMLDRVAVYRAPVVQPHTVEGDVSLIMTGKDPIGDGGRTIARMEANAVDLPPLEQATEIGSYPLKTVGRPYIAKTTNTPLDRKLEELGYVVSNDCTLGNNPATTPPAPQQAPTLGATLDRQLDIVRQLAALTAQDLRLINWHYANLEYANATSVHNLSLGSWDQDDGNEFSGKHTMLENGGFMLVPRALYLFPTRLDVRFKSPVECVTYDASKEAGRKKFTVTMDSGERVSADRVICTVPLGVLKAGSIRFEPDLPEEKKKSIQNLGFGVLNKVVLVYDTCFWDPDKDIVGVARDNNGSANPLDQDGYRDGRGRLYMFWNCTKVVGKYCLVALMAGNAAFDTSRQADEVLIRDATRVLSRMYPAASVPHPTETIITSWHRDPFSRGSYSYVGPYATGEDYDILASPACDDNLFFAGEATSRTHPATVHGAYLSGLRAAEEVFRTVVGDITLASPLVKPRLRPDYPTPTETVVFPPPPKSAYVGEIPPVPQPVKLPQMAVQDLEVTHAGSMPNKRGPKPGQKQKVKVATMGLTDISSQAQEHEPGFRVISSNGRSPTKNGAPKDTYHFHLLRAQQLRDQRLAAHARQCETELSRALGSELPHKPGKALLNPFLLFQKLNWNACRLIAEQQRQMATGDSNLKPTVADIRAIISQKWRNMSDGEKRPIIEETNRNRIANERRFAEYQLQIVKYEEKVQRFREHWYKVHESIPSEEETREFELAHAVP
ncbi:flavin-containing amine oxidoreductase-domain containing protein [Lipomyces kononenkoae]|uniref:Flavin-containing amine oxidoreductase-domain containing protein n=1 Tax=Lipomyces kononenkoae TaxID=34357 RepID=A0ACC3T4E0_LIPKO